MFTQVYFHKTRFAFDHHIEGMLAEMLATGTPAASTFPAPSDAGSVSEYLEWDDWKVFGLLASGGGGEHGQMIRSRAPYRMAYWTPEVPGPQDLTKLGEIETALGPLVQYVGDASKSWYSTGVQDLQIVSDDDAQEWIADHHSDRRLENGAWAKCGVRDS